MTTPRVLATGNTEALNTVKMADSTLEAVKEGMLGYHPAGRPGRTPISPCVVTAGAKTGTAQLGGDQTNNGVFVCFAPYDDPEIAVSIAIEHGPPAPPGLHRRGDPQRLFHRRRGRHRRDRRTPTA